MSPSATSTTPIQSLAIGRSRVTSFTPFFPLRPYSPRHAPSTVEAQLLIYVWIEHITIRVSRISAKSSHDSKKVGRKPLSDSSYNLPTYLTYLFKLNGKLS
jgi:hypothetical protein